MSEALEPNDTPRLFMTELILADWSAGVHWYVKTFGLPLVLKDETRRFALLGDPRTGQLALKEARETESGSPTKVRLVFQVDDLEASHRRLKWRGVEVGDVTLNDREHYREVRLIGPEGTPITLFDWDRRGDRHGSPRIQTT